MIVGIIEQYECVIELGILDHENIAHTVGAVLDTGYNGCLTLPSEMIDQLGLEKRGERQAMLADGTIFTASQYKAVIYWHEERRSSSVTQTAGDVLAGTQLLWNSRLTVDFVEGGSVGIEPID